MKKTLLLAGALLALTATMASAQGGINLSWTDCGTNGESVRQFACNSNSGTNRLVVSFISPRAVPTFASFDGEVQLQSNSPDLPAWWQLRNEPSIDQTGQCRSVAITASIGFGDVGLGTCGDPYQSLGAGGLGIYRVGFGGPNRALTNFVFAVPSGQETVVESGLEYYGALLNISNIRTTGTTVCAGCTEGVCLVLTFGRISEPSAPGTPPIEIMLKNPANQNYVAWQSPSVETCGGATPTKAATWGSVKALYR